MQKAARAIWKQAAQVAHQAAQVEQGFARLVERLASRDLTALWALQQAGTAAIPALLEGLQHPHPRVRRNCVDILDHGGHSGDARCISALVEALQDPVPHIRRAVWHTLTCERCRKESACPGVLPDMVELIITIGLQDPNRKLRREALARLAAYPPDVRACAALERVLREETDPELLSIAERSLQHHAGA